MLLELDEVHAHYGKSHILHGVTMGIDRGEIITLLGRNGSGRSTTLKTVLGLVQPSAGSIRFDGAEIAGLNAHEIVHRGIAYVPEERLIFPNLTVDENLQLGLQPGVEGAPQWSITQMYEYFPNLKSRETTRAGNLSGGEQQMLSICRSLLCNPLVMLVDEPTEGLAPKIVEHLVDVIVDIQKQGVAVWLVEQKLRIALDLSERIYVMGPGRIVFDGTPDEFSSAQEIRRKWLEVA